MVTRSLLLLTIYYLCRCNCTAFKAIKPIVNATGEYFIATTTVSFKDESIICNASINDCYIVCPFKESCKNTKILCSSYHCSLSCGFQGCNYLEMTTNGTNLDISCGDKGCQFLKLNGYLSNATLNSSFNLIATGNEGESYVNAYIQMYGYSNVDLQCTTFDGCSSSIMIFNTTNSASLFHLYCYDGANPTQSCDTANITVIGYAHNNITCGNIPRSAFGGCSRSIIAVKPLKDLIIRCTDCQNTTFYIFEDDNNNNNIDIDILCCCNFGCIGSQFVFTENNHFYLDMNCTSSGNYGCHGVTLYDISPYQGHNNLVCNGYTNKSIPCDNMTIYVPSVYESKFIFINYSNDTGNQFISMYCTSETCYNGIIFPIIDTVQQPTMSNESGVYFVGNTSYQYQYKSIICNSSVGNCYIYCSEFASCSLSYIQCNTTTSSICHVFASANLSFYGSAIKAIDNNQLDVHCNTDKGYCCKQLSLQSVTGDISLICNGWTSCNGSIISSIDGNINVLCGEYSCVGINILQTNNNATLQCYGDSSCEYANVGRQDIKYLHMNCSGYFGCYRAIIYCIQSGINTCNVECIYNETVGGAACYYTIINLPNTFDNGFLNVYKTCNQYNAPYQCGHMNFECNESEYGTSYIYKGSPINSNQCVSNTCCPWKSESPIFVCSDNSNCTVDCNIVNKTVNPYFAQIGCSNGMINAQNAKELIVDCSINDNCIGTTIKCPVQNGSICSIYCNGVSSCIKTIIEANYTNDLKIFCGSGQSACNKMKIYAENVNNFVLKGTISYLDIFVMNADNVDIDCINGKCSYLNLFAQNASHVNVYCQYGNIGWNGCFNNIFNLENVKMDINLWFNGVRSCNNCTIYAQFAELLNMTLLSNQTDNFQNVTIWAPHKINGTYLNCINYGCLKLKWYLENGLNDINFNYSGNCNKWINQWNIQCLIDMTNITFNGNDCSDYQSKCCNKNETERINSIYTQLCPPTNNKNKWKAWQIGIICGVGMGIILVAVIILIKRKCYKPNGKYIGSGSSADHLVTKK